MNRHDTSTWILLLINAALIVGVSIAALIGHYTATTPPPLHQVPNVHIATVFGHGPSPLEIQEIADLRTALGWESGEVERLTRALAECQRKESHDYKVRNGSLSVGRKVEQQQGHLRSLVGGGNKYEQLGIRQLPSMPSQGGQGSAADSQTVAQPVPTGGDANVAEEHDRNVTQPPVQTAPDGGHTKEETWPASNMNALADASARSGQSGNSSRSGSSVTGAPAAITPTERPSALALTRAGLPSWSGPFSDFRGDWDAPPVPQPVVSPRMMAVMAIRRPSNPPEPTLPVLCDEGDVHGRWGTEYFSQFPNREYLADKCWLLHVWKREGGDLHCFLAVHGYPSPGCVYDLHVPWESYAGEHYWGTHWLGVCTSLTGCQWIPVDAENLLGITVQVPMDLPFEQPAILRSAAGAMAGGGR